MSDATTERDAAFPPVGGTATRVRRRPSVKRLASAGLVLAVIAGGAWYGHDWWINGRFIESTDDSYVGGNVTVIAPHVSGFVARVLVADNQPVRAGQLLLTPDFFDTGFSSYDISGYNGVAVDGGTQLDVVQPVYRFTDASDTVPGGSDASADAMTLDAPEATACGVCPAAMPVCDDGSTTCRGCQQDGECPSHSCSESTGLCIAQAATLYVKVGGSDTNPCTHDDPCATVTRAIDLVDDARKFIRVYDGTYVDAWQSAKSFTLSGEGNGQATSALIMFPATSNLAYITEIDGGTVTFEDLRVGGGSMAAVRAQGGANVTLYNVELGYTDRSVIDASASTITVFDGELHDSGGGQPGVKLQGGTLTMTRSLVYSIGGPCVSVASAGYDLENSYLSGCGAAAFVQSGSTPNPAKFEFNTVVGATTGVTATGIVSVRNSIFAYNGTDNPLPINVLASYTLVTGPTNPPGIGNLDVDPAFVGADDFHITFGSPARDKADPNAAAKVDWDGEPRPHGAGFDIGADEYY